MARRHVKVERLDLYGLGAQGARGAAGWLWVGVLGCLAIGGWVWLNW